MSQTSSRVTDGVSCFQYTAPMVFGMISLKNRMAKVRTAENRPIQASPNTCAAWAPAPAAPPVCAIVLSDKIAASGSSMLSFNLRSLLASSGLRCSIATMYPGVTLSSTASMMEHRNDTPMASAI